jgi:hypothetical protein
MPQFCLILHCQSNKTPSQQKLIRQQNLLMGTIILSSTQPIGGQPKPRKRSKSMRRTGNNARQTRSHEIRRESGARRKAKILLGACPRQRQPLQTRRRLTKIKVENHLETRVMQILAHRKLLEPQLELQPMSSSTTTTPKLNHLTHLVSRSLDYQQNTTTELSVLLPSSTMRSRSATALQSPRRTTLTTDTARLQPTRRNSITTRTSTNATRPRTIPRTLIKHLSRSTSCTLSSGSLCHIR